MSRQQINGLRHCFEMIILSADDVVLKIRNNLRIFTKE